VESRMRSRPKGERLIRQELKTKGVQSSIIDAVCSKLFISSETGKSNEIEIAKRAIEKKWRVWQKFPVLKQKTKIYQHLASRGFSSSIIYKIIDELTEKSYNR